MKNVQLGNVRVTSTNISCLKMLQLAGDVESVALSNTQTISQDRTQFLP